MVRWHALGFVRAIIAELLYKLSLMKISETRTVSPASTKKVSKTKAKQGPAFASHIKDAKGEPEGLAQVSDVGGVTAIGSILAAQEIDEDDGLKSRKHLKKYGEDILDRLDEIKQNMLIGGISRDILANLAQTLRMKKSVTNDQGLINIIEEIELRAAVELAKYTRNL
jgi:hypothetical protein